MKKTKKAPEEPQEVQLQEQQPQEAQPQIVTVRLNKYKSLVDALGNRRITMRALLTLFLLGVLLFTGITFIALAIKSLYPYSDITTNALGATTIKSERNEVSYWLFNTAILWADSGIQVKEGDIITIRASGKSNTAIHHLVKAAEDNTQIADKWVGSEGESLASFTDSKNRDRDEARRKYRIIPNRESGALIMQVVDNEKPFDTPRDDKANDQNFYFIGKERQNIYINHPGTLYFAVNDIVLNMDTIRDMKSDPDFAKMNLGTTTLDNGNTVNELDYYGENEEVNKKRKTVWFDDNVGSFLIVVEKKNK